MPSRNTLKTYVKGGYYHIYNRGVAKQKIFLDIKDYKVFLIYLKESLTEQKPVKVPFTLQGQSFKGIPRPVKNFLNKIEIIVYCLMPNHFHILLKQNEQDSMEKLMRSLITRYAQYFNKKYDRVGHVFQGRYKAVLVTKDEYLLHLSRYIHLNPQENVKDLINAYSSYADYLGLRNTGWVMPNTILKFFNNNNTIPEITKINTYKDFVEKYKKDSKQVLGELTLE